MDKGGLLEQVYKDVYCTVDGVILVTALLDYMADSKSTEILEFARSGIALEQAPILFTVGTMKDMQTKSNWSDMSENDTCENIYDCPKTPRLVTTSPLDYIEGNSTKQYITSAGRDFMTKITLKDLEKEQPSTYNVCSSFILIEILTIRE